MKKHLILVLTVVAAMVSCQKEMEPVAVQQSDDNAIKFSAYTGTAVTRGAIDSAKVDKDSIGVFAFYQGTDDFNTHKFATPNFMYNQKVKTSDGTYSPVKYWPNNPNDKLSFFAYTPYESGKQWEDMGISTDVNGNKMTVTFPINQEVADQIDYLWADPTFNKQKPNVTDKVKFDFRHITSQVSLYVGVSKDVAPNKGDIWTDDSTEIVVNSVKFKGLRELIKFQYDLTNSAKKDSFYTGEQDITLTSENFVATAATINKANYSGGQSWVNYGGSWWKQLTDPQDDYMFVAKQEFKDGAEDFEFTYTVTTEDPKNSANNSVIKNVITADLYDILSTSGAGHEFLPGKVYKIYCLIGMTSVKFTVTITDWATATEHQVDVPANTSI